MNSYYTGSFKASKSQWFKWAKAAYAIQKINLPDNWQEILESDFKKLYPNITTIEWLE